MISCQIWFFILGIIIFMNFTEVRAPRKAANEQQRVEKKFAETYPGDNIVPNAYEDLSKPKLDGYCSHILQKKVSCSGTKSVSVEVKFDYVKIGKKGKEKLTKNVMAIKCGSAGYIRQGFEDFSWLALFANGAETHVRLRYEEFLADWEPYFGANENEFNSRLARSEKSHVQGYSLDHEPTMDEEDDWGLRGKPTPGGVEEDYGDPQVDWGQYSTTLI